jgi:two-component sensor histidine kinase
LATNAAKYGALSDSQGKVDVRWAATDDAWTLTWQETEDPPVAAPKSRGFGSRLLERGLANDLQGAVELSFPSSGVRCVMRAPQTKMAPKPWATPGSARDPGGAGWRATTSGALKET